MKRQVCHLYRRHTDMSRHYFLAVPVPEQIRLLLKKEADGLKAKWKYRKWTSPSDYHITLHFFGSLDHRQSEAVREITRETAARHHAFQLTLSGLGGFGSDQHPRVMFCGMAPSVSLTDLQNDLLSQLTEYGFKTEKRPFHPHITLAKGWLSGDSGAGQPDATATAGQSWLADRMILYSIFPGQDPKYYPEGIFPLNCPDNVPQHVF
jgi:2''-5'' RNA ligase